MDTPAWEPEPQSSCRGAGIGSWGQSESTAPSGSGTFQVLSNVNSMDRRAPAALGGSCELRGFLWNLLQGPCGEGSSPSVTEHKVLNRENATSSAGSDGKLGPVVLPLPFLTHLTPPLIENKQQSLSQG